MERLVIYPGSFDPLTYGHLDIIERGVAIFGRLIVAAARNPHKNPLFELKERREMLELVLGDNPRVTIDVFDGLLIDYARKKKARVILRGLRALSDFESEFQMALMNRRQDAIIETIFMMTGESYSFLSSKLIKEIASFGGPTRGLVPDLVADRLQAKLSNQGGGSEVS